MIKRFKYFIISFVALVALSGCDFQSQINDLKVRVDALETALARLESAYADGKIISKTESFSTGEGGYIVTFSDGTSITLNNGRNGADGQNGSDGADGANGVNGADGANGADGRDGVTPLMKIDEEGYWCVSYDGGDSYIRLTDSEGKPISSKGKDGEDGVAGTPGADGADGADGKDGKDGLCVRVVVADGRYVFEVYSPSDPDNVIESIPTLYTTEAGSVVQSIVRNDYNGTITLIMADGSEYKFNLDVAYPTGIILLSREMSLGSGSVGTFDFRINPSNAIISFNIGGHIPDFELDDVSSTRYGYVTTPMEFKLERIDYVYDSNGRVVPGQYRAVVRDLGISEVYDRNVVLVMNTYDGRGYQLQISSTVLPVKCGQGTDIYSVRVAGRYAEEKEKGVWEVRVPYGTDLSSIQPEISTNAAIVHQTGTQPVPGQTLTVDLSRPVDLTARSGDNAQNHFRLVAYYSNLPVVYINTPAPIVSKEEWTAKCTIHIGNAEADNLQLENMQMKGRGNSSWIFPKKSYTLKFDKKTSVLGMPKHKRWCLISGWLDKTMLRNDVAYELGRRMPGLDWTPRGEFVELVLNGRYMGSYYLCEQIRVDANRVPVAEMTSADVSGEALTGGYLLEMDIAYDEVNKFYTRYRNLPVMIKSPDEDVLAAAQFSYIRDYVNKVESVLYGSDRNLLIEDYIDIDSFIDWYLVHEIAGNGEPYWPKSCYMHKDRNGKLMAGPVWDFDWGTFLPGRQDWMNGNTLWFAPLFRNVGFKQRFKERWAMIRPLLNDMEAYVDRRAAELKQCSDYNIELWPINNDANQEQSLNFDQSVDKLKQGLRERIQWLDMAVQKM